MKLRRRPTVSSVPTTSRVGRLVALNVDGNYKLRLTDGRDVFIKAARSDQRWRQKVIRESWNRERTCLRVLKGLAIPRLVELAPRDCPSVLRMPNTFLLAIECAVGFSNLDQAGLSNAQLVAAWLFVIEQLVAFRRHEIVYSDVKCHNVLARKRPFAVQIVDFDRAVVLDERQRQLPVFGFSAGFQAPESIRGGGTTERSIVFQAGLLLPHIILHSNNQDLLSPDRGLGRLGDVLREVGCESLLPLVKRCVATNPAQRPATYEQILSGIATAELDDAVVSLWRRLRAPYAERLRGIGLDGP